jgi:hypothetical protein
VTDDADKPTDEHPVLAPEAQTDPSPADQRRVPGPFAEATAHTGEATTNPGAPAPPGPPSPILDAPPGAPRPAAPSEPPPGPPSPILDAPPQAAHPAAPSEPPPGPPSPLTGPPGASRPASPDPQPEAPAAPPVAPVATAETLWLRMPTSSGGWPAPPAPPATYLGAPPPQAWPAYPPVGVERDNGKATAALVLGIAGLVLWLTLGFGVLFFVNLPLSILAWVFGVQAGRSVQRGETSRGAGSARAGMIMGIVGVAIGALSLVGWALLIVLAGVS